MKDEDIYPKHPTLSAVYRRIRQLSFSWSLYTELFASTEENVAVMNASLPAFFGSLQELLENAIFLDIAALDGPEKSCGQPQASFANVFEAHKADIDQNPTAAGEARKFLAKFKAAAKPIVEHRHNRIAHANLAVYSGASVLPGITNGQVSTAVDLAFKVFNAAASAMSLGGVCLDRPIVVGGDGGTLLDSVKGSLAFHAIERWCWTPASAGMSDDDVKKYILDTFCCAEGWKRALPLKT
jgi:hypothetical protein